MRQTRWVDGGERYEKNKAGYTQKKKNLLKNQRENEVEKR